MRIVMTGGGTGGHLYPAIALAETFQRLCSEAEILFVGTRRGIGAGPLEAKGFAFEAIASSGFVGKGLAGGMKALLAVPLGLFEALKALKRFSPKLVIGMGGYVTGPVLLAAFLLGIKRVILEPNVMPGLANRLSAPLAQLVFTAFEAPASAFPLEKVRRLGIPVRPEIIAVARRLPRGRPAGQSLLILGGSQGAHSINRCMIEALPLLKKRCPGLDIMHQTGKNDLESVTAAYREAGLQAGVQAFIDDMAGAYERASLVLSRAGAGTLAELAVLGKPSLLIPFPYAAAHQEENAAAFAESGAAVVIREGNLSGASLAEAVLNLLFNDKVLTEMGAAARRQGNVKAAEDIVTACLKWVGS